MFAKMVDMDFYKRKQEKYTFSKLIVILHIFNKYICNMRLFGDQWKL